MGLVTNVEQTAKGEKKATDRGIDAISMLCYLLFPNFVAILWLLLSLLTYACEVV